MLLYKTVKGPIIQINVKMSGRQGALGKSARTLLCSFHPPYITQEKNDQEKSAPRSDRRSVQTFITDALTM